jgi:hypothetical protein
MLTYSQSKGTFCIDGQYLATGYSGFGNSKNRGSDQAIVKQGPIPLGLWSLTGVADSPHTGPFTITLVADAGTNTFGRSAFRIHGDSISAPGRASFGCIVINRAARDKIWASGERKLTVIE